jgi:hypothetical protein
MKDTFDFLSSRLRLKTENTTKRRARTCMMMRAQISIGKQMEASAEFPVRKSQTTLLAL